MKQWWSNRSNAQRLFILVAVLFVVAINLGDDETIDQPPTQPQADAASGDAATPVTPETQPGYGENDIEYQLAVVDSGGFVDPSDPTIDRYDRALNHLEDKCGDDRRMLGDMAVRSVQLLDEEGISSTALEVLTAADSSIPADMVRQDSCSDTFATLIALMSQ